ncbi:helix-turn-helix transcriptional regulator [Elizabethkingia miricola]|uniref:helix-turn-helix domain-containing protein n=1 Tax=Elizabethkingia miricola TaxID=172045 RepID=UPI002019D300|nr:helix-turn-helix transcriptional regulator [Elizabethkingia miricola]MCL1658077.1 helix-turn-helix transcriptional regulator [Elizabethkingia miricola]
MSIKDRYISLRDEKGVTNYTVSEKTGIHNSALGRLEKGQVKNPNEKTIAALAKFFDVNEDWLRTGNGEKRDDVKKSDLYKVVYSAMMDALKDFYKDRKSV